MTTKEMLNALEQLSAIVDSIPTMVLLQDEIFEIVSMEVLRNDEGQAVLVLHT